MKNQVGKLLLPLLAFLPRSAWGIEVFTPRGIEDITTITATDSPLTVFREQGVVVPTLFDSTKNYKHDTKVFTYMTDTQRYKSFIAWIINATTGFPARPSPPTAISSKEPSARIRAITVNDVSACQSTSCCEALGYLFHVLPKESLKGLSQNCIRLLVKNATAKAPGYMIKPIMSRIPEPIQIEHGDLILHTLESNVSELADADLRRLTTLPSACRRLTKKAWTAILRREHLAKVITPECMREGGSQLSKVKETGLYVQALGGRAFIYFNHALHPNLLSRLTAEQLQNFAKDIEDGQFPGAELDFTAITSIASKGLTLRIILGSLYKNRATNNLRLRQAAWRQVPSDIFSNLTPDDLNTLGPAISADRTDPSYDPKNTIQSYMNEAQLKDLFKYPTICAVIEPIVMKKGIPLTRECFLSMAPDTQGAALYLGVPLPDDALDSITASMVEAWTYEDLTGLEVLTDRAKRPNQAALIAKMGSKVQYDHPCRAIGGIDVLKKVISLQLYMSPRCFINMSYIPEPADFLSLKPRMAYLVSFKELKKKQPKEFWTKMTPEKLVEVMSNEDFCKHVDVETMLNINHKAYSAINPECYSHLRGIAGQLAPEAIHNIPPETFAKETSETTNADLISKLTPNQLASLGSVVGDQNNPATLFTLTMFNTFGTAHLAKVTAQQWKHTPAAVFATFSSAERLHAVDSHRMVFWSVGQVKSIPENVVVHLKLDQIETIGKALEASQSPISYLAGLSFSEDIQQALKRRLNEMPAPPELGTLTIVIITVSISVVVAGIAIGIYFVVRRD